MLPPARRSAAWSARQGTSSENRQETSSPLLSQPMTTFFRDDDVPPLGASTSQEKSIPSLKMPTPLPLSDLSSFPAAVQRPGFAHSPLPTLSNAASPVAGHPSPVVPIAQAPPMWKKALYERQPFDDNYVDPVQFLQELKKNSNLKHYEYTEIAKDTLAVVQQISLVVVFVFMFSSIIAEQVSLAYVIAIDIGLLFVGALCYTTLWFLQVAQNRVTAKDDSSNAQTQQTRQRSIERNDATSTATSTSNNNNSNSKTISNRTNDDDGRRVTFGGGVGVCVNFTLKAILFGCALLLLSPVFQTLTASYTDDTIWALAIMSNFLHLLLTDYGYLNAVEQHYTNGLGVNAATFGSILMASRIASPLFGAALIGFGILLFNLSPLLRHRLRSYSVTAHVGLTFLFIGVTMGCLVQVPLLAGLFMLCVVFTCGVVPYFFVWLQASYKNQISGPWDEAKPLNSSAAAEWANAGLLS